MASKTMNRRVEFRATSDDQYDELKVYAQLKGFKDLSAFALYSCVQMMAKNGYTEAQKPQAMKLLAERQKAR